MPSGTVVHGAVSQAQFAEKIGDADCFVLPSRHDSFGLVVIEAMAVGLPVIISNNVGAREMIVEGSHGWVVPSGSIDLLALQMGWCAAHAEQVRAMRSNVRAQAEKCSWRTYHARVVQEIQNILSAKAEGVRPFRERLNALTTSAGAPQAFPLQ